MWMWVWASGAGRVGAQQGVERAFQVCEGIAFARDVAIRGVALHLRIAQAPERHRFGVEPDDPARSLVEQLHDLSLGLTAVVARVAENQHSGAAIDVKIGR